MQAGVGNKRFYKRVPSALQSAAWIVQEPILGLFTLFQKPATALSVCVAVVVVGASSDTSQWSVVRLYTECAVHKIPGVV